MHYTTVESSIIQMCSMRQTYSCGHFLNFLLKAEWREKCLIYAKEDSVTF